MLHDPIVDTCFNFCCHRLVCRMRWLWWLIMKSELYCCKYFFFFLVVQRDPRFSSAILLWITNQILLPSDSGVTRVRSHLHVTRESCKWEAAISGGGKRKLEPGSRWLLQCKLADLREWKLCTLKNDAARGNMDGETSVCKKQGRASHSQSLKLELAEHKGSFRT